MLLLKVFSGVVPTNVPLDKSRPYYVAKSLGANVSDRWGVFFQQFYDWNRMAFRERRGGDNVCMGETHI